MKINYETKTMSKVSSKEYAEMSNLFCENYGNYSQESPKRPGEPIYLKETYYRTLGSKPNTYVTLAKHGDLLVGHAIYILEETEHGNVSWVVQLVVHKDYRKRAIGKKLLLSVWGFSDDYAWGLATTNPLTVKTLEAATCRNVSFSHMKQKIDVIKKIASKVNFVDSDKIQILDDNATVDTSFYVDHKDIPALIEYYGEDWPFGPLVEGHEWLAFIFRDQPLKKLSKEDLDRLFEFSEENLIDAYSRMKMKVHPWATGTMNEVDFISKYIDSTDSFILDFGCGQGRHLKELFKRGYHNIKGIDFSETNIKECRHELLTDNKNMFECYDIRKYKSSTLADNIICLYDVIGSFPQESENIEIIRSIFNNLKPNGIAIISVMNMELTDSIAKYRTDVYDNPEMLFNIKSSNIMQSTGDIFDPDYYIIDTRSKLVFRKEKFVSDGHLATEYIVRDKRYQLSEICGQCENIGFSIIEKRFVRAGAWAMPLSNIHQNSKEILLVLKKPV